jgi:DNA-binding Lrp family transcriptional regulator
VLIQVAPGTTQAVAEEISGVRGVIGADGVVGPYDVIARVEAVHLDELANIVVTGIQSCHGVSRTLVCVIPASGGGS